MQINQVYRHKKVLMGFLGYRDVNDKKQFEVFPFSEKPEEMVEFLKQVEADGGDDTAEDIKGAFEQVQKNFDLPESGQNILILIADAPTHGIFYHSGVSDNLLSQIKEGSLEESIKPLMNKSTNLILFSLNDSTDIMFKLIKSSLNDQAVIIQVLKLESFLQTVSSTILKTVHNLGRFVGPINLQEEIELREHKNF